MSAPLPTHDSVWKLPDVSKEQIDGMMKHFANAAGAHGASLSSGRKRQASGSSAGRARKRIPRQGLDFVIM